MIKDFDSEEERLFYYYIIELQEAGYIESYNYQPESFILSDDVLYEWDKELKTKTNIKESKLLSSHIYTIDFIIKWNEKAKGIFYNEVDDRVNLKDIPFVAQNKTSYIEVKGAFDFNNMTRLAIINIKWVYEKYGIYVQKVIPIGKKTCLFAKTFTPQEAKYTKRKRQLKKHKFEVKSLDEYIKERLKDV